MAFKLVAFDFDGTLANSFPFFVEISDKLAETHGFRRVEKSHVDTLRGYDAKHILKHIGLPIWKLPQVGMHFMSLMAENIHHINLFPGVGEMLHALHNKGIVLAIVTSNSVENVKAVLGPEHAQLISYYECGASLFGKRTKLRRLLAKVGMQLNEVICIGDEVRDVEAAHAEKMAFGAVAWGYTKPEALLAHSPEMFFSSVADISTSILH